MELLAILNNGNISLRSYIVVGFQYGGLCFLVFLLLLSSLVCFSVKLYPYGSRFAGSGAKPVEGAKLPNLENRLINLKNNFQELFELAMSSSHTLTN